MIVVDASAMVEILLGTPAGQRAGDAVFAASSRHAPALLDIEVTAVLRRFVLAGQLSSERALEAIEDLEQFRLLRHDHLGLLERALELRANLTAYDAIYVALAEALDARLLTCDKALIKTPGTRVRIEWVD
jgi:predicted nucleic acid-binding protein